MTTRGDGAQRSTAPATRLESQAAATRLEGPAATRLDSARAGAARASGYVRLPFPPSLAARLVQGAQIGDGGEAIVYRATYRDGKLPEAAVKLFIHPPKYAFELDSADYRAHFVPEHTVRVFERGHEGGQHWEVMEYCHHGTLQERVGSTRYALAELIEIVREVASAIGSMHPYVHGDIKPSNILIRSAPPALDLVLTDFGVSVDMGGRSRRTNTGKGTVAYLPPGGQDAVRTANDWWALGMTVLDLVLGRNVFQDPSGRWMDDSRISEFLATDSVPMDDVSDPRVRLLLRGLLQRSYRQRWGLDEILAWCVGESPPVPEDVSEGLAPAAATGRPSTAKANGPIPFGGVAHYVPADLGAVLQRSPDAAKLGRGVELAGLVEWLAPFECIDQVTRVTRNSEKLGAQLTAALVAALIQPDGQPIYRGFDLSDQSQLAKAAEEFTEGQLTDLWALRPMYQFSVMLDMPGLGILDERWRDLVTGAERMLPSTIMSSLEHTQLRRRALRAVLAGEGTGALLAKQARNVVRGLPDEGRHVQWFHSLAPIDEAAPASSLARIIAAPAALEAAQRIAMQRAAEQEEERQSRILEIQSNLEELQRDTQRLTAARSRVGIGDVVWPAFGGGAIALGMFMLFGIGLIAYSIAGLIFSLPDAIEWFAEQALQVAPSGDFWEYVAWFIRTLYFAFFGALIAVLLLVRLFIRRHFGAPSKRWLGWCAHAAMLLFVVQPWDILAGDQFPFTTNVRAFFLWPAVIIAVRILESIIWGAQKANHAQLAENRRRMHGLRRELSALEGR